MNTHDEADTALELVDEVNQPRRIWLVQSVMMFVLLYAMIKGVPACEKIFKDFDAELPRVTQYLINVDNLFLRSWFLVVGGWLLLMGALHLLCRTGESSTAVVISRTIIAAEVLWLVFTAFAALLPLVALMQKLN